ncbi:hypothetical protein [Mycolicibacterium setense]|uniref:hypothetical protein n=1 Tax=Mycolicibacterium setense TaxID=431269 RepID=UPI00104085A6|nr:hypothetical protein [Mycolicibacterium setense]MCV7109939.1 hypothetical protein [Mycolicibacterium setense]
MPVSVMAWMGLTTATDHLVAIQRHIEARQLFSLAHLTLCRSALIGAAQAAWVLSPTERADRVKRARTVALYLHGKHHQYLRGLQESVESPHEGTDLVAAHVDNRRSQLAAKRAADGEVIQLNTTEMIRSAAAAVFNDEILTRETVLAWQAGSGTAHGLVWPLFGTTAMAQSASADADGVAEFQAGGSLSLIANPYLAAFHIAQRAWALLEQRGSGSRN